MNKITQTASRLSLRNSASKGREVKEVNYHDHIMASPHILGRLRIPIIIVFCLIGGFQAWNIDANLSKALLGILGGALGGWIVTTELLLKVSLSSVPAGIAGLVFWLILDGADAEFAAKYGVVIVGFGALVVWIVGYQKLDKSSWIGTPCQHCFVRGKTDKEQIAKQFLGQKTEKQSNVTHGTDARWVTYNLYHLTYRNWCNSCGTEWQTTRETKERA